MMTDHLMVKEKTDGELKKLHIRVLSLPFNSHLEIYLLNKQLVELEGNNNNHSQLALNLLKDKVNFNKFGTEVWS
jgi:hypothetical protein